VTIEGWPGQGGTGDETVQDLFYAYVKMCGTREDELSIIGRFLRMLIYDENNVRHGRVCM
jgi:hypothetical protein